MEAAISFDQPYTVKEVQGFFNLKNKITWYWVNEYKENDKKLQGLHRSGTTASIVYGFHVTTLKGEGDVVAQNEADFLATLEELRRTGNYDFIIDRLLDSAN
jgi:hypothetical protein